jgi:uncharacterized protein GlcG (DUF336 family)
MLKIHLAVLITAAAVLLVAASSPALPQTILTQKALSLDAARAVADGALEKCRADGYHVSVSVIDTGAMLKAFLRDDGTGPHTIDFSRRKAYTALTFKRTSAEFAKSRAANPSAATIEGTVTAAGGVPIFAGNQVIGAVGVSGAPGGDKDEACANAGIAKIAEQLK